MSGTETHLLLAAPGTRVLLVGSGTYAAGSLLPEVDAVPGTVADLGRCLVERAGLDPANLTTLVDPATPMELGAALVEAAEQATDVLVVHYVGHGLVGADGELYLATQATVDLTKGIPAYQALPYSILRQALARCMAPIVVVVLDCCFSGRASGLGQAAGRRLLDATPRGTYLLAAAGRDQAAFAPPGRPHTAFTGALIDLLTHGDPTAPALLDLDDIYRCLSRTLPEQGYPAPRRQATDHGDRRPVAPNPAFPRHRPTRESTARGGDADGEFSPYRGLAVFTAADADYFFGREELTRTLVDRVAAQAATGEPLVVTGPSGSGKSSLLRAGLIASLRRATDAEIILLTPGADPLGALAARLARLDRTYPADLRVWLEKDPAVLRDVVADTLDGRRAVLIVDQFEELFTVCGDERQRQIFIQALHALCGKDAARGSARPASAHAVGETDPGPAAVVILGVRADFFGHCTASPDGKLLASGSDDRSARIWVIPSGTPLAAVSHRGIVSAVAFSPDGKRLATAGDHGQVWEVPSGRPIATLTGHGSGVPDIAFSPDGTRITTADEKGTIRVWDAATHKRLETREIDPDSVTDLAFSPNGTYLATIGVNDRTVTLWDIRLGVPVAVLTGHARSVNEIAFSPDGSRLATADHGSTIRIWDTGIGKTITRLTGHAEPVTGLAVSPDGSRLATADYAGTVRIWDTATRKTVATVKGRGRRVRAIAFGPTGTRLAIADDDGTVRLWDAATHRTTTSRIGGTRPLQAAAFSPDGKRLATADDDSAIRLWEVPSGRSIATLTGHTGLPRRVAFSPDGKHLATTGDDGTIRIWDTTTRRSVRTLKGQTGMLFAVAFSPDGKLLAAAGDDPTVRPGRCLPAGRSPPSPVTPTSSRTSPSAPTGNGSPPQATTAPSGSGTRRRARRSRPSETSRCSCSP